MSVKVREVLYTDWESIANLFQQVYQKSPPKGFEVAFKEHTNFLGFCLELGTEQNKSLVGFFGCFTFEREINGVCYKFYNNHTWIVLPNYRKYSIQLLMPYLRIKDGIVTNFTPSLEVYEILKGVKFQEKRYTRTAYQVPLLKKVFNSSKWRINSDTQSLEQDSQELVNWHLKFNHCKFHLFKKENSNDSFWILTRTTSIKAKSIQGINKISKLLVNKPLITNSYRLEIVHYCNNWQLLSAYLNEIVHVLHKSKVGGLIISEDRLNNPNTTGLVQTEQENEFQMFKYHTDIPFRLDMLYSEIFYMDVFNR